MGSANKGNAFAPLFWGICIVVCLIVVAQMDKNSRRNGSLPSASDAVHVAMRSSLLGSSSGVLQITNITGQTRKVRVLIKNLDNQQTAYFEMSVAAQQTWDIGWTYGWSFEPHEEVTIYADGYNSAQWLTTKMDDGGVGIRAKGFLDSLK